MRPISAPPLTGQRTLTEYASKSYLAKLGIQIPRGVLAGNLLDASEAAAAIGFPVALKLQAPALPHKSDAGAVLLGINDETQFAQAWAKLQQIGSGYPDLAIDGVLVEAMAPRGLEMIVGARRDPDWEPVTLVGLGGIWAEALHDIRVLPVGLDLDEISEEIGRLRAAPLLRGMRGDAARDVAALAAVVQRIGALLDARPDIQEVDLNPATVYDVGQGVLALDALIVMNTPDGRKPS